MAESSSTIKTVVVVGGVVAVGYAAYRLLSPFADLVNSALGALKGLLSGLKQGAEAAGTVITKGPGLLLNGIENTIPGFGGCSWKPNPAYADLRGKNPNTTFTEGFFVKGVNWNLGQAVATWAVAAAAAHPDLANAETLAAQTLNDAGIDSVIPGLKKSLQTTQAKWGTPGLSAGAVYATARDWMACGPGREAKSDLIARHLTRQLWERAFGILVRPEPAWPRP